VKSVRHLNSPIVEEFAEKKGALKLADQIRAGREKIKEQEEELSLLGFHLDSDDDVVLDYKNGQLLRKTITARLDKDLGTEDDIDARFDSAKLAMLTVASLEDAEKLIEIGVLDLEDKLTLFPATQPKETT